MKKIAHTKNLLFIAFVAMAMGISSCKEEPFPVPVASSQAKFTYSVNIVDQGGTRVFEVQFTNQSIGAASYSWDFANGTTSTEENPFVTFTEQGDYNVVLTITPLDNTLYYNKTTFTSKLRLLLKETILIEPFDGIGASTPETWLPDGWLAIDEDGDTYNWYWAARSGNGQIRSQSYADGVGLNPSNWLITKEIDLRDIPANVEVRLSFNVCPSANTAIYRQEKYGVYIASPSGTTPAAFTNMIWEERLLQSFTNWVYQFREIDISDFKGQVIRISFRHFDTFDMDRIIFDDVEVYKKF
jgi:hypothetical protein